MRKNRILHVANLNSFGGIQKLVVELVHELNIRGSWDCSILSTGTVELSDKHHLNNRLLQSHKLNSKILKFFWLLKLYRSYDIIHFHGPYTFYQLACYFVKTKIVYTEHGTLQKDNIKRNYKHYIQKRIIGMHFMRFRASKIIVVSNWLKEDINLKNNNVRVIFNGLKEQPYERKIKLQTEQDFQLVIAARMVQRKRVNCALEVMELLKDEPVELNVLGTGPEINKLKEHAARIGNPNIRFLGYREDAEKIIANSDFYLMTTLKEPFGLVVLEAMMNDTLVLALSDSLGPVEILGKELDYLVVENIHNLSKRIKELTSNPILRKRYSQMQKAVYKKHFKIERMVEEYEDCYADCL